MLEAKGRHGGFIGSVTRFCEEGRLQEAIHDVELMQQAGLKLPISILARLLQICVKQKNLEAGRWIHSYMVSSGLGSNVLLGNHLIRLCSACGDLNGARQAFGNIRDPDTYSWAAMISAHAKLGQPKQAIKLYQEMQRTNVKPNDYVYNAVLMGCAKTTDLTQGRLIHAHIIEQGYQNNLSVGNTLINMYVKCQRLDEAVQVFQVLPEKDIVSWNALIAGYAQDGLIQPAFEAFKKMQQEQTKPDRVTFTSILKACSSTGNLAQGKSIHAEIIESGLELDAFVGSSLVNMYAKCGGLDDARQVFEKLPRKDVVMWNTLLSGYIQNGLSHKALRLFKEMQLEGCKPDTVTFLNILKACGNLAAIDEGLLIHAQIAKLGLESEPSIGNCLAEMHAKCGRLDDAKNLCGLLRVRTLSLWKAMIAGYVQNGRGQEAFQLLKQLQQDGIKPDTVMFVSMLKVCGMVSAIDEGRLIHAQILNSDVEFNQHIASALIDMYVKCGNPDEARQVFEKLTEKSLVTWNAMLGGYAHPCLGEQAIELYEIMQQEGVTPDGFTFVNILKACGNLGSLSEGKKIHAQITKSELTSDVFVGSALVDMYIKCGNLDEAEKAFNALKKRNVVSWNTIVTGFLQHGLASQAMKFLEIMHQEGVEPDATTFISILKACASTGALDEGKQIHALLKQKGLAADICIASSLIDMYAKCGSLVAACEIFDEMAGKDVVSWNAMIAGFVRHDQGERALQLFGQMQQAGMMPDRVTFVSVLKACGTRSDISYGKLIHAQISDVGLELDFSVGSALIDMYSTCGDLDKAQQVFNKLPGKNIATWNAMISSYAQHGLNHSALELFHKMEEERVVPNRVTFINILKACGSITAISQGEAVHEQLIKSGLDLDLSLCTSLIDMYSKCGNSAKAYEVFNKISGNDLVAWNAMIAGYAQHGLAKEALKLFDTMQDKGIKPNEVTFVSLISACSHTSLLNEGMSIFEAMVKDFEIVPNMQHYACVVDLLSRAGELNKAVAFIESMPFRPDPAIWMSVLGACQIHGNLEIAQGAFESVLKLNPTNAAAYLLMSKVYAFAGRWNEVAEVERQMAIAGMKRISETICMS
ncbi:hypothetical protein O6H91_Y025600 [Diphasiastrum complanatum]|nr:hypothetical protein O6H91_Y291900 [Diphasiastrum complanatum]KAJ7297958.1 hypothetical protein O6H91_Y025600 [Diphasiastrum complanatum]